jgi:hypothetical protein
MQTVNVEDQLAEVTQEISNFCISSTVSTTEAQTSLHCEEWRPIGADYPGYCASTAGRIKGLKGKIFNRKPNKAGYIACNVINNKGKTVGRQVHVLVAMAFVPNPECKPIVNHINSIRHDNRVENLEWATHYENSGPMNLNKLRGDNRRRVIQYSLSGQPIQVWESVTQAARSVDSEVTYVSQACLDIMSSYRGYQWRYYEDMIQQPDGEEWRSIVYNGRELGVSNLGRVRTSRGQIIGHETHYGYMSIKFDGIHVSIHRLVCLAWKPIENAELFYVNHIDNNGKNNRLENLEWVTAFGNRDHYCKNFLIRGNSNQGRPVEQLSRDGEVIAIFGSAKEAFEKTGVQCTNITKVCQGKTLKSAGGFIWRYHNTET